MQTVQKTEFRQVPFLDRLGHARCCATTGLDGPDRVQSGGTAGAVPVVLDEFCGSEGFFRRILRHFSRSFLCPGVERQFSVGEPSMMKSSSSRARGVALTPGVGLPGVRLPVVH